MSLFVRRERARGCGYRKAGGLYLVADGPTTGCGRLPMPLHDCVACGRDLNPVRGWSWIKPHPFLFQYGLELPMDCGSSFDSDLGGCADCPLGWKRTERAGLIWIGAEFYTPASFAAEARAMGISRRIPRVPADYVPGQTWVLFAHRHAFNAQGQLWAEGSPGDQPGVLMMAQPYLERVVGSDWTGAQVRAAEEPGVRLVVVIPVDDNDNELSLADGAMTDAGDA